MLKNYSIHLFMYSPPDGINPSGNTAIYQLFTSSSKAGNSLAIVALLSMKMTASDNMLTSIVEMVSAAEGTTLV